MEEHAQHFAGKVTKPECLKAIEGLFRCAFTPENIKKGFEKTGTWPINFKKITAEMTGPLVGSVDSGAG